MLLLYHFEHLFCSGFGSKLVSCPHTPRLLRSRELSHKLFLSSQVDIFLQIGVSPHFVMQYSSRTSLEALSSIAEAERVDVQRNLEDCRSSVYYLRRSGPGTELHSNGLEIQRLGIKSVISETPLRTPRGVRRLYAKKLHGRMTKTSANQEMPTRLKNTRPNIFVRGLRPRMRMISNQRYGSHQAGQVCVDAKGAEAPIRELICFEQN